MSSFPRKEECIVSEHLLLNISSSEKKDCAYFLNIRDKVLSLISFALQNNINVISQNFIDYDIRIFDGGNAPYYRFTFILYEQKRVIYKKNWDEYIFLLSDMPENDNCLAEKLDKLIPIFNLGSSLFRYRDMPIEMIFLNLVQAVETFHSRFFCEGETSLSNYIERIKANYKDGKYKIDYVTSFSRINELVFDYNSKIFYDLYGSDKEDNENISDIVRTRNYYTHYDPKQANKILDDNGLIIAIKILKCILEYHVCKALGIDKAPVTRVSMSNIRMELENTTAKKSES